MDAASGSFAGVALSTGRTGGMDLAMPGSAGAVKRSGLRFINYSGMFTGNRIVNRCL